MNEGILNSSLLEKNIKYIDLYSKEENISLNKICDNLMECSNNYNSSNVNLFLIDIESFKTNIDKIMEKRNKYTLILNKVMIQYQTVANDIQNKFDSGVGL